MGYTVAILVGLGLTAISTLAVVYLLLSAAINGAGHTFGYKGFDNDATNLRLLALITFSEGLHNNHHARPAAPKLSAFRGEFDPAWTVIRLLQALRLAKVTSKVDEGWDKLRRRIPPMAACSARASSQAVEQCGRSKSEATRLFSLGLSSVKRYTELVSE